MDARAASPGATGGLRPGRKGARPWQVDGGGMKSSIDFDFKFRTPVACQRQMRTIAGALATIKFFSPDCAGCCVHSDQLQRFAGSRVASCCASYFLSATDKRRSSPARRRKFGRVVTAAQDEWEGPVESQSQKWTLEQLDEQLRILQEAESSASRRASDEISNRSNEGDAADKWSPPQWPVFSYGFIAFAGIGLMVLTVINNTLYRVVFGPQVVDRQQVSAKSEPQRPRFRVTSLEQEREARTIREAQMAAQSREAPSTE